MDSCIFGALVFGGLLCLPNLHKRRGLSVRSQANDTEDFCRTKDVVARWNGRELFRERQASRPFDVTKMLIASHREQAANRDRMLRRLHWIEADDWVRRLCHRPERYVTHLREGFEQR